jgi:hypothetical protein
MSARKAISAFPEGLESETGQTLRGSKAWPFLRTSKWRWGPVERPVDPTHAMGVWDATGSPTWTSNLDR